MLLLTRAETSDDTGVAVVAVIKNGRKHEAAERAVIVASKTLEPLAVFIFLMWRSRIRKQVDKLTGV